jgi:hypothetical protein
VSPATITADLYLILRQHPRGPLSGRPATQGTGEAPQRGCQERGISTTRITVRLSPRLVNDLKQLAHQQGRSVSAVIRERLQGAIEGSRVPGAGTRLETRRAHAWEHPSVATSSDAYPPGAV